jgi:hypothetical protein
LQIDGVDEASFDVIMLPGVRRPGALGFQDDIFVRLVGFPRSNGLVVPKLVVRALIGPALQKPGLPRWELTVRGLPAGAAPGSAAPQCQSWRPDPSSASTSSISSPNACALTST